MRKYLILIILLLVAPLVDMQAVNKKQVRLAVSRQMQQYPASTLQDIYKNFFQDRFGPGHIVADTARAGAYLREELKQVTGLDVPMYEASAERAAYYRVSLAAIKSGLVSYEVFFSAFIRSVTALPGVDVSDWAKEWASIEKIIRSMSLDLPNYEEDARAIEALLAQGYYAVHHSKAYNLHYQPHYRLIEKKIFEKEILPLLK
ncbi:MAG: hypothetical protein J6R12_06245 [Bacteroidales bacterium]|nr:hypothetical protein [Bacteroidales bacterium]MBO5978476.1 hypothetical protein [Bacteroidales bacterium]MBO7324675.1 hypothetical protein [Bacteroidales bacterium]